MKLNQKYSREDFLLFLKIFIPNFERDIRKVNSPGLKVSKDVYYLGKSADLDIAVFELVHTASSNARISLATDGFRIMKESATYRALVIYQAEDNDDWRLSLMTASPEKNKKGKAGMVYSNPRRFSYFLGPDAKTNTPYQFLIKQGNIISFEELKTRFSMEVVNKEFYKQISESFAKLVGGTFGTGKSQNTYNSILQLPSISEGSRVSLEFAVRLIGRIIFCWFLREKKSQAGISLMPNTLLSLNAIKNHSDYYHQVLEPIFFEVLNKPEKSRKEIYSEEPFSLVPYLNGGLFTPHDEDFFSYNEGKQAINHNILVIPDEWFAGIYEILETYNFTIDENTSFDEELSIDPEMLGRIFENLLAEINPETGETARKSTGSYYTPRAIVNYMVDESLVMYLIQKTQVDEDALRALVSYDLSDDDDFPLTGNDKRKIIDALEKLKLLDPACGSGAFPIGALQKIVFILQQIDPDGYLWFEKQLEKMSPELKRVIKREFSHQNFDYIRKLGIIRQNIYGVDIQPIATEISRLRCFLTLVVEQFVNDNEENRNIQPLPNLEFKFVTANTLIGLPQQESSPDELEQVDMFDDRNKINELKSIREQYFTTSGIEREQLRTEFVTTQKELIEQLVQEHGFIGVSKAELTQKLTEWKPFSHKASGWFDSEWMFGITDGFDIVLGNPPYLNVELMSRQTKDIYLKLYNTFYKRYDVFGLFFELSLIKLVEKGTIAFIVPSQVLNNLSFKKLRNLFLSNHWLKEVLYLGDKIFKAANNDVCVLFLHKPMVDKIHLVDGLNFEQRSLIEVSVDHFDKYNGIISVSSGLVTETIAEKIFNEDFVPIRENFDVFQGIVTGNNAAYILSQQEAQSEKIEDNLLHPVLLGRDFEKWMFRNTERKIIYIDPSVNIDDHPNAHTHLIKFQKVISEAKSINEKSSEWYCLHRPRDKEKLDFTPKLLVQGTRNPRLKTRIVATLDTLGVYGTQGINFILPLNDNISIEYLLAILNSALINYLYQTKFLNMAIKAEYLKNTPIPTPALDQQNALVNLVNQIISTRKTNSSADISTQECEIDQLVYKMYGLNNEEIATVEESVGR